MKDIGSDIPVAGVAQEVEDSLLVMDSDGIPDETDKKSNQEEHIDNGKAVSDEDTIEMEVEQLVRAEVESKVGKKGRANMAQAQLTKVEKQKKRRRPRVDYFQLHTKGTTEAPLAEKSGEESEEEEK